LHDALQ
jgi:hypothetical protein